MVPHTPTRAGSPSQNLSALSFPTWVDIARWRAKHTADKLLYTFLKDKTNESVQWSYRDLDRHARAVAGLLQQYIGPGERVLLMYPPGLDYIGALFGCLYAGMIAVPTYPPSPTKLQGAMHRVHTLLQDAQPRVVLTTKSVLRMITHSVPEVPALQLAHWLTSDTLDMGNADIWQPRSLHEDTIALIQYTSGSIATPKGVVVTHKHLFHNAQFIQACYHYTVDDIGVSWLPFYHDMGLMGAVFQPLYVGGEVVFLSPMNFLQQPIRWLETMTHFRGTISAAPNFAYDLCCRRISTEQRETLDLSQWRVAINGAEPIRPETIQAFTSYFGPCGFRSEAFCPSYGMAETTLLVVGNRPTHTPTFLDVDIAALEQHRVVPANSDSGSKYTLIGCGVPVQDQRVIIVNPDTSVCCADNEVGEIWVTSPNVAHGYWGQTDITEMIFHAYINDTREGPFLRTGDLGFLYHGELFITGRCKDVIIIRGRNLYPQDIEHTVGQSHPAIQPHGCVAFSSIIEGEERLIILVEIQRRYRPCSTQPSGASPSQDVHNHLDGSSVIKAVRRAVVDQHDVLAYDIVLLQARSILRTSSGKVQRRACQSAFAAGTLNRWDKEHS